MVGRTNRVIRKAVFSEIASCRCHAESAIFSRNAECMGWPVWIIPALFTRMSARPCQESTPSSKVWACASNVRSATKEKTRAPDESNSRARSAMRTVVELMATLAPCASSRRATAKPIPSTLPAPVTIATWFSKICDTRPPLMQSLSWFCESSQICEYQEKARIGARQHAIKSSILGHSGSQHRRYNFHEQRESSGHAAPCGDSREGCKRDGAMVHGAFPLQSGIPGCDLGDAGV